MVIDAACGCHMGKHRKNNEDNFSFDGKYLETDNCGLETPLHIRKKLVGEWTVAVFDGMGGENFGELASFAPAKRMTALKKDWGISFRAISMRLQEITKILNQEVLKMQNNMLTYNMGSTMVCLSIFRGNVYLCNVGDSRAYWFHDGELTQLSVDHVSSRPMRPGRKAPLTQYLGIDPEEMSLEPHIVMKRCTKGEWYLLCSDGLTDMLTDDQIAGIMRSYANPEKVVDRLIHAALDRGGKDNITVVVCSLD